MKLKKIILIIISSITIIIIAAVIGFWYMINKSRNDFKAMEVPVTATVVGFNREAGGMQNTNSQWRGENRDGIYNETGLLKEWAANGPELLWYIEGLGDGYSSPAIANGKIYIAGLDDDNLVLFVFDLNGKFLNRKVVGKEWNRSYQGARSTITVNDGKLYIYNSLGHLHCLDEETLDLVWKKDVLTDFDGNNIFWGMTESPLILDNKVFITPGGEKYNMVALNKNTGNVIWFSEGEGDPSSYCSPLYIGGYPIPIVVTHTERHIIAFNADTGEKLWSHPLTNKRNIHPNTPIYSNGMIFSTTGYGGGSMLLRLTNEGRSVEQVWSNNVDNQIGGAVKVGDYVFTSGHNNRGFYCINWHTGEIKYKVNQISPSAIIAADGMLYVYSEKGEMALVKPNPDKFELAGIFNVTLGTNQHWAHPVIHNGVLYIRHGDVLMAYGVR
ncbi:MAG: PQQ-binding-like beta-propeller repeat protein [Lentimicrobiaceae bacterium]|nr:PQQ-binding-like beta-propeller repeat protein [Lentimicrobiaceae bacterium]